MAVGWQKATIEDKPFWTFNVSDHDRLDALKAARKMVDERKELLHHKIEGAVKALEQVKILKSNLNIGRRKRRES